MKSVLITDTLASGWQEVFAEDDDVSVDVETGLSPDALRDRIGRCDALIVRSETRVDRDLIGAAHRLRVVGRAGAGVDNIDIDAASERGIIVVNAPGSNTVSTAEHTVGMLLALSRAIPQATGSVKSGIWDRKRFTGVESRLADE